MPFAGAGPSVGVEPAAKRRRKGQLMPKVKELDETHGISLTELISVFHVLHRDVDGRVPLREIASLVAGRRLASGRKHVRKRDCVWLIPRCQQAQWSTK